MARRLRLVRAGRAAGLKSFRSPSKPPWPSFDPGKRRIPRRLASSRAFPFGNIRLISSDDFRNRHGPSNFPGLVPQEAAADCLSPDERLRAARFRFHEDALQWVACRASLRRILGETVNLPPNAVPLVLSEFGKPSLPPPFDSIHFNLSHCTGLAVVALGIDGPVGIDLEKLDRAPDLLECESTFCHPEEVRNLPDETSLRSRQLLQIWTAKEAGTKALGAGLSQPPENTRIVFDEPTSYAVSDSSLFPGSRSNDSTSWIFPNSPGIRRLFQRRIRSDGSIFLLAIEICFLASTEELRWAQASNIFLFYCQSIKYKLKLQVETTDSNLPF